ncbi:MAG: hypothetical protein KA419_12420 [Acidobacteria bacterium]|nr:hypothetical protein [Acidobacteriota bacterium]
MRKTALILIAAFLASSASCLRGPQDYTSNEGKYKVTFPAGLSTAKETREKAPLPNGDTIEFVMVTAERDEGACVVGFNDFPAAILDQVGSKREFFDGGRRGALGSMNGKLNSEKDITVSGNPGRSFTFTGSKSGKTIHGRADLILVKNRLYQLMYMNFDQAAIDSEECRKFFESFALVP